MLSEDEIIAIITKEIPSGPGRVSGTGTHDAEICVLGKEKLLFTTDEFSSEDFFPETNPYCLGWNIAGGAISDIYATGGIPRYYAHALTIDRRWTRQYLGHFSRGVRAVLDNYKVTFIGGDTGKADRFRCTASVIGIPSARILSRYGASPGDILYVSGRIGAGNYNAALQLFLGDGKGRGIAARGQVRVSLLDRCAAVVARYATACIDTSDGCFRAVTTLADCNATGYRLDTLPFCTCGIAAARILALPELLLFFGECGEYALLYTVNPSSEAAMRAEMGKHRCNVYKIGTIIAPRNERTVKHRQRLINVAGMRMSARDFNDTPSYVKALLQWIQTV